MKVHQLEKLINEKSTSIKRLNQKIQKQLQKQHILNELQKQLNQSEESSQYLSKNEILQEPFSQNQSIIKQSSRVLDQSSISFEKNITEQIQSIDLSLQIDKIRIFMGRKHQNKQHFQSLKPFQRDFEAKYNKNYKDNFQDINLNFKSTKQEKPRQSFSQLKEIQEKQIIKMLKQAQKQSKLKQEQKQKRKKIWQIKHQEKAISLQQQRKKIRQELLRQEKMKKLQKEKSLRQNNLNQNNKPKLFQQRLKSKSFYQYQTKKYEAQWDFPQDLAATKKIYHYLKEIDKEKRRLNKGIQKIQKITIGSLNSLR